MDGQTHLGQFGKFFAQALLLDAAHGLSGLVLCDSWQWIPSCRWVGTGAAAAFERMRRPAAVCGTFRGTPVQDSVCLHVYLCVCRCRV